MNINKLIKVGDSYAITIPPPYLRALKITHKDLVRIDLGVSDTILITKLVVKRPETEEKQ